MADAPPPAKAKPRAKVRAKAPQPARAKVKAKPRAVEPGTKPPARARARVKAKPRAAVAPVSLAVFVGDGVEISITASDLSTVNQAVAAALGAEGELEFFDSEFEEWAAPSKLVELNGARVRVVGPDGPVESPLVSQEARLGAEGENAENADAVAQEAAEDDAAENTVAVSKEDAMAADKRAAEATVKQAAEAAAQQAAEEEAAEAAAKEASDAAEKEAAAKQAAAEEAAEAAAKRAALTAEKDAAAKQAAFEQRAEAAAKEAAKVAEREATEAAAKEAADVAEKEAADAAEKEAADAVEKEAADTAEKEAADTAEKEAAGGGGAAASADQTSEAAAASAVEEAEPPEQVGFNVATIADLLQQHGLAEYTVLLTQEGFDDVDELKAMTPEDLKTLCQDVDAAATHGERTAGGGTDDAADEQDAEANVGGSGGRGGFKMMRKARDAAKDAANMSMGAAKSAKRSTRRFSLEGVEDDELNPYDVGHEDDTDEEESIHNPGEDQPDDGEQPAKVGGGGFGLGRVGSSISIGKNLDLSARAGAGLSKARDASKAAMEKAARAQEAATKAARLAEERSREVASSLNMDISSLIEVSYEEDGIAEVQHAVVREDYTPSYDSAIGGSAGDRLIVLDGDVEAEWWQVKVIKTGEVGFMPKSFVDPVNSTADNLSMAVPTAAEVLSSMGLADGGAPSDLEQKLAERIVELSEEVAKLRKVNGARLAKEEKRRAVQARKQEAERKKKQELDAKEKLEKQKAAARAAALMEAMMDDGNTSDEDVGSVATDTDNATNSSATPAPTSKLASALRNSVSRDSGSGGLPQQARMAMIVQNFGPDDEGWDTEGGTTVAVEAGMAVRILDDSSDPEWWKVTVPAGGDKAEDQTGRIPARAALSTAAGGKGDWRAVTDEGNDADASASALQEPEPVPGSGDKAGGGGRKFGKGLSKGIGAGGMLDKAKRKAEKAAAGAAAGATAVAARASGSGADSGANELRGVLIRDYTPSFDRAIGGSAGDGVVVLQKNDAEWWTCRLVKSGEEGFMPKAMIQLS